MDEKFTLDEELDNIYFRDDEDVDAETKINHSEEAEAEAEAEVGNDIDEFNMNLLEKANEKFYETKRIIVSMMDENDEPKYSSLNIDTIFSPIKTKECVKEFLEKADQIRLYYREEDMKSFLQIWLVMLIVKHFSSLEIPNDFKKQLAVLEQLINTEILYQIFGQFSERQILKITKELNNVVEIANLNLEKYGDMIQGMEEEGNKIIKNQHDNLKSENGEFIEK